MFLLLGVVLVLVPIGYLSGDAVYLGDVARAPTWSLNPNHILLEPAARAWVRLWQQVRPLELPADALTRLSLLLGGVSALIFRATIAPLLTADRLTANLGAAAFIGASAFDRLWVSGEVHMIQMPFLAGMLARLLHYTKSSRAADLVAAGACGAISVLAFAANVVLVAFVTLALLVSDVQWRTQWRRYLAFPLSAGLTAGAGALLAWFAAGQPGRSVIDWLTSYRGDASATQHTVAYGLRVTPGGIVEAAVRSTFGLVSALVDVSPLSGYLRQGFELSVATIAHPLAALTGFAIAFLGIRRLATGTPAGRLAACSGIAVAAALWLFGAVWDNSDDQFFFQITPWWAAAVVGFSEGRRAATLAPLILILVVNAHDLAATYILPNRTEKVALLQGSLRPGLVVAAGGDDAAAMLAAYGVGSEHGRLFKIRSIADSLPASQGLAVVRDTIRAALARGETVTTINVLGMDSRRFPWPGLTRRGYPLGEVELAFEGAIREVTVKADWVTIAEARRPSEP